VSHQAHRLRLIGDIVSKATTAKDFGNALKGLELAAKEMGGLGTVVEHKGIVSHVHGSIEDARRELADRLRGALPMIELVPQQETEGPSVAKHGAETNNVPKSLASGQDTADSGQPSGDDGV
jgi:hypothetical protein